MGGNQGVDESKGNKVNYKAKKKNAKHVNHLHQSKRAAGQKEVNSVTSLKKSNESTIKLAMSESSVIKRKNSGVSAVSERNGETPIEKNPSMLSRLKDKEEREKIVLWRKPLLTLQYFIQECIVLLQNYRTKLWRYRRLVLVLIIIVLALLAIYHSKGPHQKYVHRFQKKIVWFSYWIGLGVLSSIGLGTGLHTFLLYLGPHIASVTLAANECGSLNFPEPPYPDEIICPDEGTISSQLTTIWDVMSKVRPEAFMWGAGTALGELPPYFMARAARLSGFDEEEEDLEEYEHLRRQQQNGVVTQSTLDRAKLFVQKLVEKVGFLGILACASIPNPLFDLAGITCGHFLVPFWTFFGATLIGKAVIKMHIQKLFVIIAFNEDMVAKAVAGIKYVPYVGKFLQVPFKEFMEKQKSKWHRKAGAPTTMEGSWLSWMFEKFVITMVMYFLISIVNSFAQNYHKRIHKRKRSTSQRKITPN